MAWKDVVADLARPFSIIVTSASAAAVPIIVVWRMQPDRPDLLGAAALVAAIYTGVGALYWGKAVELLQISKANAEVEKERAKAPSPPAEALKPPPPEPERSLEDPA